MMERQYNLSFNYTDDFNITNSNSTQKELMTSHIMNVVEIIILCIGLPLTLVAICAVYCQVQRDQPAHVYIVNLFISDLIQLCCIAAWTAGELQKIIDYSYTFAILASVGFMVCISLERYLVIAKPLWYKFRRNIKTSIMVCAMVWALALAGVLSACVSPNDQVAEIIYGVYFLLPLPLLIFFLVGTIKALSAARNVPAEEKRRIVAILVVVLIIYTLLFLPNSIWCMMIEFRYNRILTRLAYISLLLSPLADLTLYFCIRRSVMDKLLKSLCYCKMSATQEMSSTGVESMSAPCTGTV